MAILNKNNQKVKLADGLTEIGISQVKKEIGGSKSANKVIYAVYDGNNNIIVNPTTFEPYLDGTRHNDEEYLAAVNQICEDYGLELYDDDGSFLLYNEDGSLFDIAIKLGDDLPEDFPDQLKEVLEYSSLGNFIETGYGDASGSNLSFGLSAIVDLTIWNANY